MRRRGFLIAALLCFMAAIALTALLLTIHPALGHPFDHERPADAYQPVVREIQAPCDYTPRIFRYKLH